MTSFNYDLRFAKAGADILENYLLSKDIYWPIGVKPERGEPPYPQMSLGGLLLELGRARARASHLGQQGELEQVLSAVEVTFQRWPVALEKKADQEMRARLTQWRNFLEDYRESSEGNYDRYTYEVFRRVIIELLLPHTREITQAEQDLLRGLDALLKSLLRAGEFVWEEELQAAFPAEPYWYLYGVLPKIP